MCTNLKPSKKEKFIGFKIVAKNKKTGDYHSILTGNKYPKNGEKIPVWYSQKKGSKAIFNSSVLAGTKRKHYQYIKKPYLVDGFWEINMVGRTAAFKIKKDAFYKIEWWKSRTGPQYNCSYFDNFNIVVVKVEIENDLMTGKYDDKKVCAGRKLTILKEVK